jgi:hypothetical protein
MQALQIDRHGPHHDIVVREVPAPRLGRGEVRVELHFGAAGGGVNPTRRGPAPNDQRGVLSARTSCTAATSWELMPASPATRWGRAAVSRAARCALRRRTGTRRPRVPLPGRRHRIGPARQRSAGGSPRPHGVQHSDGAARVADHVRTAMGQQRPTSLAESASRSRLPQRSAPARARPGHGRSGSRRADPRRGGPSPAARSTQGGRTPVP